MPELPDVEIRRRRLARRGLRRRITGARALDRRMLQDISAPALERRLKGRFLTSTRRHGKYLFAGLSRGGGWLVLHFGMTGDLQVQRQDDELPEHLRLRLDLDDGRRIAYTDVRRFGRIALAASVGDYVEERGLGPDPVEDDVGLKTFRERLKGKAMPVKAALMDQSVLAGLGNVYVDEVLFQARIHPRARTDRLGDRETKAVHTAMRRVLQQAIKAGADPDAMPRSFLLRQRHEGGRCPRCGRPLRRETMGGRSTYYCAADARLLACRGG